MAGWVGDPGFTDAKLCHPLLPSSHSFVSARLQEDVSGRLGATGLEDPPLGVHVGSTGEPGSICPSSRKHLGYLETCGGLQAEALMEAGLQTPNK